MSRKPVDTATPLLDQRLALSAYFDALLDEEEAPAAEQREPEAVREAAPTPSVIEFRPPAPRPAPPPPDVETPAPPPWAQEPFQCVIFKVAGLALAAPLVKLNGIIDWSPDITPLPNRSSQFLGLLHRRGVNVKVIDTALAVVPEKHRARAEPSLQRKIVLVDEQRWGLVCDRVLDVVTLSAEQVRWRKGGNRRAWLAGTVVEHMCALLDVDAFVELLGSDELAAGG
jgi:purine-binding chemotaxis protein CheW